MKLTFIGAAQTVTGSMHLLEVNGTKILMDCGLYQGKRKEAFEINRTFDLFDPKKIDVVILSHAHIDHSGNLPNLVKQGFTGPIYSTFASRDLAGIMLRDSAHIQEKDVEFVNKKRKREGKNPFEPLYTDGDVLTTTEQFIGINYRKPIPVAPGVKLTFYDAGHILGSAVVHLEITEKDRVTSFGFSGDLGRPNLPILRDPEMIPQVDHFICESTYGGRLHDDYDTTEGKMAEIIKNAAAKSLSLLCPRLAWEERRNCFTCSMSCLTGIRRPAYLFMWTALFPPMPPMYSGCTLNALTRKRCRCCMSGKTRGVLTS